ncbi:hypothetical protein [Paenibacillus sp. SYP-B4298]|uniref:hypothetical protein n=1 Tax=Paenibacillus sp. SYP-B4298 TaxID=2996034 RepID=UPI0022DD8D6D|nr:hypothetical protein [Paenibacillus sp. SYP-B4298]
MDYNWETWKLFLQENWIMLLAALVVLLIVIRIVRTVVKWAIVAVIVLVIIVYSGYTLQDLKDGVDSLKDMGTQVTENLKQEVYSLVKKEAADAVYSVQKDGSFNVKSKNIELSGKAGEQEVAVSLRGLPLGTWKLDETLQGMINEAKRNG